MSKPNTRRVILRAARFAIASGGICLLLSFPAQQAHAATGGQPSLLGGLTGVLGSIVSTVTGPVTGTASAVASAPVPANQVTPTASGSPPSQPAAPPGGQASPAVTATPPGPAATSPVASSAGAATPTAPGTSQSPVTARPAATPASGATAPAARCHASSADPGYRDGGTRSEQGGQSFRARHNRVGPGLADAAGATVGDADQSPRRRHPGPHYRSNAPMAGRGPARCRADGSGLIRRRTRRRGRPTQAAAGRAGQLSDASEEPLPRAYS